MATPAAAGEPPPLRRAARTGRRRASGLRVTLLGEFAVTADGVECTLPKGVRRLVALLALNPGGLPRSSAAKLLTPHLGSVSAAASLRTELVRLREHAPRSLVEVDRGTLRLGADVAVDSREIEALARRLADPSPEPRELSAEDVELLTRELLPGWDEKWVRRSRDRLRDRSLHGLDVRARALAERGAVGPALDLMHAALDADPVRETAARVLIEIHLSQANTGAAKRAYLALHEDSMSESGLEPSEELQDLVAPLFRGRPARRRGLRIRRRSLWEWVE